MKIGPGWRRLGRLVIGVVIVVESLAVVLHVTSQFRALHAGRGFLLTRYCTFTPGLFVIRGNFQYRVEVGFSSTTIKPDEVWDRWEVGWADAAEPFYDRPPFPRRYTTHTRTLPGGRVVTVHLLLGHVPLWLVLIVLAVPLAWVAWRRRRRVAVEQGFDVLPGEKAG